MQTMQKNNKGNSEPVSQLSIINEMVGAGS
jgi:hypothetical protein